MDPLVEFVYLVFFLLCAANEKLLKVFGKAKNGKLRVIKVSIENGKQLS